MNFALSGLPARSGIVSQGCALGYHISLFQSLRKKTDHERTGTRATDRGDGSGGFDRFDKLRAGKLSRAIDRLVYELYGLSEEEIRLVEGAGK